MFNGMNMMDPELMKLAQEQMSRISPADFARMQQQMMANPELMKMASESMKNMRPEDLKLAAEKLKHTRPEEMAEIGEKIASASPEEIAAMHARVDGQVGYKLNAAQMLKNQGNALHSQGKFNDALQKYVLAKTNLNGLPSSKGTSLLMACSLNLMSCYLKTRQYDECIKEGSEVLAYDAQNVKALYRRGQAYKELDQLEDAVSDLSMAHEVSPDDETIADVLRDAKEKLGTDGSVSAPRRLVIEEITEEVETVSSANHKSSSTKSHETRDVPKTQIGADYGVPSNNSEHLQALKNDPATLRSFQDFISNADPNALAALSSGKSEEVPADMVKTASSMIGKMSPEELKKMIEMASSFEGPNPFLKGGQPNMSLDMLKTASDMMSKMPADELQKMFEMASKGKGVSPTSPSKLESFKPGSIPPTLSPDMLKTASDMMSKMPPEELQKMFEMASSMTGRNSCPTPGSFDANKQSSSDYSESHENSAGNIAHNEGASSSHGVMPNVGSTLQPSFPASAVDLQEQMRNQMKDPAMRQMMSSMMKSMSPDMMANMSQQFGLNLSREDAEKAHQAMSSLSPESLDKMMQWMDKIQRVVEGARKTKNWLMGKSGLILAIIILILAVILHRLGYIGG
ncbi:outer envelope protein 61 [Argentina anserina]|uniref:outer envelope protein 61 n=1 Tax=Argentina anserina TaxID=57926 RepID=UPI00217679BF|nr:outer envelope protein 61 [Potentilla anserina]